MPDSFSKPGDEAARARQKALDLLARREHSHKELSAKLTARGFAENLVEEVLISLTDQDLLSESRFAEAYVAARHRRGMGPVRLRAELQQRGVAEALIDDALAESGVDWVEAALQVRHKKFGSSRPVDLADRARQTRFLEYRGFDSELIRAVLDS